MPSATALSRSAALALREAKATLIVPTAVQREAGVRFLSTVHVPFEPPGVAQRISQSAARPVPRAEATDTC